ncbi:hypothetical protein BD779DRAFT_437066 [Infundibulicybe gibba]|nr:hypothetical protein BD779DRAFT_437066 [Infundibulicybe gibba]
MDLSNTARPTLALPGMEFLGMKPKIGLYYCHNATLPFPNHARGFFYYYRPPDLPFMASGLRFRVTPGINALLANFDAGEDLLLPSGVPWQVAFPRIALSSFAKDLREHLLRSSAITQSQLDTCHQQFKGYLPVVPFTLYSLDQPFPISFSNDTINLCVVGPNEIFRIRIQEAFSDLRRKSNGRCYGRPYRGSALAQFKVSTRPEHAGRNILIMQILKITQPVTCVIPGYDGCMPLPGEGSLLYHRSVLGPNVRSRLWTCDLDKSSAVSAALRALHDIPSSRTLEFQ